MSSSDYEVGGTTPLHIAAGAGHLPAVKLLVDAGANVNAADDEGETPLCKAARAGSAKTVGWLLAHGAAVEGTKGKSPLAAAALADKSPLLAKAEAEARDTVALLMRASADLNGTYDGSTALALAHKFGRSKITHILDGLDDLPQVPIPQKQEKERRRKDRK